MYKGVWQHAVDGSEELVEEEVAVKTMEDTPSEEDRVKLLQEAAIMGQFNHPNVVKIIAISVTEDAVIKTPLELSVPISLKFLCSAKL